MKKYISILLTVMLVFLSCFITAFAESADSVAITIHSTGASDENSTNETYSFYKIFDVVKTSTATGNNSDSTLSGSSEPATEITGYNYTISTSSPWYETVQGLSGDGEGKYFTLTDNASDATKKTVSLKTGVSNTETTAKAVAAALAAHTTGSGAIAADFALQTSLTKDNAAPGYYLVVSSAGSNLVLATTDINITEKNAYPSTTKTVAAADAVLAIGDSATYTITVTVPSTVIHDIVIHEALDERLKYTAESFTVTSPTGASTAIDKSDITESSITADSTNHTNTWTWTLDDEALAALFTASERSATVPTSKNVVITYTAKLLDTAEHDTDYVNTEYVTYSNYQTSPATASVKTYDVDLLKTDGTNELSGAEFELRTSATDASTAIKFVFDSTGSTYTKIDNEVENEGSATIGIGSAKINGLDSGTYYLVETKAPDGYNMLQSAITVEISTDGVITVTAGTGNTATVADGVITIVNNSGVLLPSTGGIGMAIVYGGGATLMLAAIFFVVYVLRKKTTPAKQK